MVAKNRPSQELQINLPIIKRQYSSAISPLLTPITASSTYSPLTTNPEIPRTPGQSTPFDSHTSFELELRFTEKNGEYICTFETPRSSPREQARSTDCWTDPHEQLVTPDRPSLASKYDSFGSTSSNGSCVSLQTPIGIESNPYIACDSPTIPGANMQLTDEHQAHDGWSAIRSCNSTHSKWRAQWSDISRETTYQKPYSHSGLLSPITIVLDTIQEHSISEAPRREPRVSRKTALRMNSLPEIKTLPAIDLFQTVYQDKTTLPEPPTCPLPPPPFSTSAQSRPAPQPRRANSENKIQQLLGKSQVHKAECLQGSFVNLPFHYQASNQPRMQRMYDMI